MVTQMDELKVDVMIPERRNLVKARYLSLDFVVAFDVQV
jgi:hypothetical protein